MPLWRTRPLLAKHPGSFSEEKISRGIYSIVIPRDVLSLAVEETNFQFVDMGTRASTFVPRVELPSSHEPPLAAEASRHPPRERLAV